MRSTGLKIISVSTRRDHR